MVLCSFNARIASIVAEKDVSEAKITKNPPYHQKKLLPLHLVNRIMTTLEAIHKTIAPELEQLNEQISSQLSTSNQLMNRVVSAQLSSKGKQIRPIIVILCSKLCGQINENTIAAAASVELLHNATLIHDDVVDDSKTRRNRPTINSIWDNHIAVLVGDYFVSCAMQQAISTGDIRIIDALCHLGKLLSLGEIDQIYNARYHTLTEDAYYNIISNKTASLFVACAKMGCYASGVFDSRVDRLAEFARLLGLCFQIRDDVFDYFGSDAIGKPTSNDLREGKITLPLLHTLLREDLPDHAAMLELSKKEILDDSDIATLISYAVDNGGIDFAFEEMHRLRDEAVSVLSDFPESEIKASLISLFDYIIKRDH